MKAEAVRKFFRPNEQARSLNSMAKLLARVADEGVDYSTYDEEPQRFITEMVRHVFDEFESAVRADEGYQINKATHSGLIENLAKAIDRASKDARASKRKSRKKRAESKDPATSEHIIDLDADPFIPSGWSVEKHQKGGTFKWDPAQVRFWLTETQQNGKSLRGDELLAELAAQPELSAAMLNANVLDYLVANPHLIPEEWKDKKVIFWGTVYSFRGQLWVRYLMWWNKWEACEIFVTYDMRGDSPAAVRVS